MSPTVLSFYCDDTNPYNAPPEAFKTFLDYVSAAGIAGEASLIPGFACDEHGVIQPPLNDRQAAYIEQMQRAYACGVDTHFELMTHQGLYDFDARRIPPNAMHEGVWLHEPAISVEEYETYFAHILAAGAALGVQFSGMTEPGCGCERCQKRFQELEAAGSPGLNPNVWQALLRLASQGKFRSQSVPCFIGSWRETCWSPCMARSECVLPPPQRCSSVGEGWGGVFDLSPNARDLLGLWLNDPTRVDADYYISADGQRGRIVELARAGAEYCIFYSHWQGLNPANGVGWRAFTQVVERVQKHLRDQVVWMRPSAYTDRLLAREG